MQHMERATTLRVDWNEVYDDDFVWTSMHRMAGVVAPEPGDWVELYDWDGDRCFAIVTDVDGPIVTCKIDWSQWRPAPDVQVEGPEQRLHGLHFSITPNAALK